MALFIAFLTCSFLICAIRSTCHSAFNRLKAGPEDILSVLEAGLPYSDASFTGLSTLFGDEQEEEGDQSFRQQFESDIESGKY